MSMCPSYPQENIVLFKEGNQVLREELFLAEVISCKSPLIDEGDLWSSQLEPPTLLKCLPMSMPLNPKSWLFREPFESRSSRSKMVMLESKPMLRPDERLRSCSKSKKPLLNWLRNNIWDSTSQVCWRMIL